METHLGSSLGGLFGVFLGPSREPIGEPTWVGVHLGLSYGPVFRWPEGLSWGSIWASVFGLILGAFWKHFLGAFYEVVLNGVSYTDNFF